MIFTPAGTGPRFFLNSAGACSVRRISPSLIFNFCAVDDGMAVFSNKDKPE